MITVMANITIITIVVVVVGGGGGFVVVVVVVVVYAHAYVENSNWSTHTSTARA